MNPTLEPEDLDNMVIYDRSSERRSGTERRVDELMKNKDLRQAAETIKEKPVLSKSKFVGDFG